VRISITTYQLSFLILIGAILRFTGITWGIPIAMPGVDAYFIDETWMMEAFAQMNPSIGDFSPDMGYREGGLAYFIISAVFIFLKFINVLNGLPNEVVLHSFDYGMLILVGRCVVACFDLLSIALVFFTLRTICRTTWAPFAGALSLTVFPFEVIYSHYLRTHIIGNTFLVLVIFFSFLSYSQKRNLFLIFAGISVGLATATRYTMISSAIFPFFALIISSGQQTLVNAIARIPTQKITYLIILSIIVAFIIGNPHLIFDYKLVKSQISYQSSFAATSEFSLEQLLNLSRIKTFIWKLIPDGTGPGLWVAFYAAIIFLPIRPKLYKYSLPLLGFVVGFSYFMGKGYFTSAIFVRTMLPTFPIFALCLGLALDDLLNSFFSHKLIRSAIYITFYICIIPAALFASAYVCAMGIKVDPKVLSANYLLEQQQKASNPFNLALVGPAIPYTFPTLIINKIANPKSIELAYSIKEVNPYWAYRYNYVILNATDYEEDLQIESLLSDPSINNTFEFVAKFKNELTFLGFTFDYTGIAHDMSYPLNRVYIIKSKLI
jgi:hypothetical protein